jgi:hypothetical protein
MDDVKQLMKGLLEGLKSGGMDQLDDILECLKAAPENLHRIEDAIHDLKHFDVWHWKEVKEALEIILGTMIDLYDMAKPCVKSGSAIESIIKLITNLNISTLLARMGKNLIFHGGHLYKDLKNAIDAWKNDDYYTFGYNIGDFLWSLIMKLALLENNSYTGLWLSPENIFEFLTGFLKGIHDDESETQQVIACLHAIPDVQAKLVQFS